MALRKIEANGEEWEVAPSGHVTQFTRDEFALVFTRGVGPDREQRVIKYSPIGSRNREQSFAELTDDHLRRLLERAQPSWTSPETGYRR
jgi:hypothetical protein